MTKTRDLSDFLIEGGADLPLGKPHIVPDVLYPAVAGNDINGTDIDTSHGSTYTYGELHTDGRKYYYTDIKGSKPIKDPRIGGHFGSQRHKFKSIQLLEQETAIEGKNVYSIDGREWVRAVDSSSLVNDDEGCKIELGSTTSFIEIVGYFSDINYIAFVTSSRNVRFTLDGGNEDTTDLGEASVTTPLVDRYVDSGSVINVPISATLGIHTVKLRRSQGSSPRIYGIELIAQDTTSTANRSKIQIPSQNVVSFGKKFTVSGTPHYDPFTTMSYGGSGTTLSALQSLIDTDTSLGMDAWKAGTSNYHRPWNGGRVIKWVDSSGTIKTSVNMMPPNAQNITATGSNAVSDAHIIAGTNDDTINFDTVSLVNSTPLHEVAKTFHWREFGNGSANGTTSYSDASTLNSADDIAYVMDDGLTSLSSDDFSYHATYGLLRDNVDDKLYLTFVGTGISWNTSLGIKHWAQNLPYGTHILELAVNSSDADAGTVKIDGATVKSDFANSGDLHIYKWHPLDDITFHQPKRPPIPEDACVIADYMLMADFVVHTGGEELVSKGTRVISTSRDHFYDCSSTTISLTQQVSQPNGFKVTSSVSGTGDSATMKLPYFGTDFVINHYADRSGEITENLNSDVGTASVINSSAHDGASKHIGNNLGLNELKVYNAETNAFADELYVFSTEIATPIHTSSHYQSFETPYLHELVGGDRNMEQTNLVVSPDGKTWDEVTRDTSYIGSNLLNANKADNTGSVASGNTIIWNKFRGGTFAGSGQGYTTSPIAYYNKNFAIAYDRFICLVAGQYELCVWAVGESGFGGGPGIKVNGSTVAEGHFISGSHSFSGPRVSMQLDRGDEILYYGGLHNNDSYCSCFIRKL